MRVARGRKSWGIEESITRGEQLDRDRPRRKCIPCRCIGAFEHDPGRFRGFRGQPTRKLFSPIDFQSYIFQLRYVTLRIDTCQPEQYKAGGRKMSDIHGPLLLHRKLKAYSAHRPVRLVNCHVDPRYGSTER